MVGVGLDRVTPMEAWSNEGSKKDDGGAGDFDKVRGRIIAEEMVSIGGLEFHNGGFNGTLTLAKSLTRGTIKRTVAI